MTSWWDKIPGWPEMPEWQRKAIENLINWHSGKGPLTALELRTLTARRPRVVGVDFASSRDASSTIHSFLYANLNPPKSTAEHERRFMVMDQMRGKSRYHDTLLLHSMLLSSQVVVKPKPVFIVDEYSMLKSGKDDWMPSSFTGESKTWSFDIESRATTWRPLEYQGQNVFWVKSGPKVGQYPPPKQGRPRLTGTGSSLPLTTPGGLYGAPLAGPWAAWRWRFDDPSGVVATQREAYLKACNSATQVHDAVPPEQRLRVSEVRSSARNELRAGVGKPGR